MNDRVTILIFGMALGALLTALFRMAPQEYPAPSSDPTVRDAFRRTFLAHLERGDIGN